MAAYDPNAATSKDNQLNGSTDRARVGGSGFTVFTWDNEPILYARQISHRSPTPVGAGTVPIHPMDTPYPVELITPLAATMGELVLELYELYGSNVWERLSTFATKNNQGPVDIVGIFNAVANTSKPIRILKYIKPPKIRNKQLSPYTQEYNNCVVSQVMDGETIEVGTMEVLKQMVVNYTHITQNGRNDMLPTKASLNGFAGANDNTSTPPSGYR